MDECNNTKTQNVMGEDEEDWETFRGTGSKKLLAFEQRSINWENSSVIPKMI